MSKYRSRLVVEAEPIDDGYVVTLPSGASSRMGKEEFHEQYQAADADAVLDWRGPDSPVPGRMYDADGAEIDLAVFYADLESGLVFYRPRKDDGRVDHFSTVRAQFKPPLKFVPKW